MSEGDRYQRAIVTFDGMALLLRLYRHADAERAEVVLTPQQAYRLAKDLLMAGLSMDGREPAE